MDIGGKQNQLLMRLLGAATRRADVIAGNLANQNTPGYIRKTVQFEDLVRASLERGGTDLEDIRPLVLEDRVSTPGPDGNNVNHELEMNSSRRNKLLFDTYATILQSRFSMIQTSIQGGS